MADLLLLLGECVLRSTATAAGIALLLGLFRLDAPRCQHALWTIVVVLMLVSPALLLVTPEAPLPVLPARTDLMALGGEGGTSSSVRGHVGAPSADEASSTPAYHSWVPWLVLAYGLGVVIGLGRLVVGTIYTRRLIGEAQLEDGHFTHPACAAPVTAGWFTPILIFPRDWRRWSAEHRALVWAHETEHARCRDPLTQWLALLNRAIFWFHPLAWWLERRLTHLAEEACDRAVLARGYDAAAYAACLVRVAQAVGRAGARLRPLNAGVRGGDLRTRIDRIVSGTHRRPVSGPRVVSALATALAVVVACTAALPVRAEVDDATLAEGIDLAPYFGDLDGTFVLLNGRTNRWFRHNAARAREPFSPCSTFKVAYAAMLLESGVAPDGEFVLRYDPALQQPALWARDLSLRAALKLSANWYFDALGQHLGGDAARRFVRQFDYGAFSAPDAVHRRDLAFWYDGDLRVSADDQVRFLQRLHDDALGLSARTTRLTKEMMLTEETGSFRLSAKTGACQPAGEEATNWYVGFVERANSVYYFALELGGTDLERGLSVRIPMARAMLRALGVLG
jgi:beta-lactamase class D/beta-lactamase regulating signal transducer with metallopeptidase domain